MADTHVCKNCGAIEDLKTGQLSYKGDNPLLKENQALKDQIAKMELKNKHLARLAGNKPKVKKAAQPPERSEHGKAEEDKNPWHY